MRGDILVEYKCADFNQIQLNFDNNPMELYSFLDGKILFDNKGILKQLMQIAGQKYNDYCISDKQVKGIAHWLHSTRIKIHAAMKVNDVLKASYILNTSTWVMLEGIWAINNKPIPPSSSVLVHMKKLSNRPSNLDDLLNKVFLGNTMERIHSAIIIIEWVLLNLEYEKCYLPRINRQ